MEFTEEGPTHRALQGPDVGTAQMLVTDSNPQWSPQGEKEARPMPLYTALSENSREINQQNTKIIDSHNHLLH